MIPTYLPVTQGNLSAPNEWKVVFELFVQVNSKQRFRVWLTYLYAVMKLQMYKGTFGCLVLSFMIDVSSVTVNCNHVEVYLQTGGLSL